MGTKNFKDLIVWQKAHQFVLDVYKYTNSFPSDEIFGITSQFRRAAVSIAANIAEGYGRFTPKDRKLFYRYARGSLEETKAWLRKLIKRNILTKERTGD